MIFTAQFWHGNQTIRKSNYVVLYWLIYTICSHYIYSSPGTGAWFWVVGHIFEWKIMIDIIFWKKKFEKLSFTPRETHFYENVYYPFPSSSPTPLSRMRKSGHVCSDQKWGCREHLRQGTQNFAMSTITYKNRI